MKDILETFKTRPVIEGTALITLMALLIIFAASVKHQFTETFLPLSEGYTLVIDPGHGGIDGGAVGVDGSRESDINLAIALRLSALCGFMGCDSVLSRSDDSSRTENVKYSEHKELVYRAELANNTPGAVFLSIHQNCYPTAQPSGAQVIYSRNGVSESFGQMTHGNLIACLDPQNRRVAEPDKNKLYVLSNVKCPAILVECGFVSNHSDITKLNDPGYQRSLSVVLLGSYIQYINSLQRGSAVL